MVKRKPVTIWLPAFFIYNNVYILAPIFPATAVIMRRDVISDPRAPFGSIPIAEQIAFITLGPKTNPVAPPTKAPRMPSSIGVFYYFAF